MITTQLKNGALIACMIKILGFENSKIEMDGGKILFLDGIHTCSLDKMMVSPDALQFPCA